MINYYRALVVKWISRQSSELELGVRILPGARSKIRNHHPEKFFIVILFSPCHPEDEVRVIPRLSAIIDHQLYCVGFFPACR